ncbi:MAG: ATP-dependent DNA helicase RecG [bacterium]
MMNLSDKIGTLPKVSKPLAGRLKRIGLETVQDLLGYYPFRYEDFSQVSTIANLRPGMSVTVKARIELIGSKRSFRQHKMITEALVSDETGSIKIIWFNQPWIGKTLHVGEEYYFSAKVTGDMFDFYFSSPNYERVGVNNVSTARVAPVYSLTDGVTQKQLRHLIKAVISLADGVTDYIPAKVITENGLINLSLALKYIHYPPNQASLQRARERLGFDELFLVQTWSQMLREALNEKKAPAIKFLQAEIKELVNALPFELTIDQKKAAWEVFLDLEKERPMNRLLEGDVGSGKTLVAVMAMYNVALNKCQSVIMAPTEILAGQHFKTVQNFLRQYNLRVGLLTRTQRKINEEEVSKKEFLEKCEAGEIDIIIGTHAIIQDGVKFKKLALAVIDEQHRFGVKQRQSLKSKGFGIPHFLSLTATPIPRSLALSLYGDLDLSIIKEMPKGRQPIVTKVVAPVNRQPAYDFIAKQIEMGRQAFVVCPLIEASDKLGVRSATEEFEKLSENIFPKFHVGLLHGKLKAEDKEAVIKDFRANVIQILVATSVIEVGVDIPNASVMMIEGSERFGLAQLHQFRGRVGRGEHQSYCFLFSDANDEMNPLERLKYLAESNDGFYLAQKDLELRGAGQVYGYDQSGFADFKIANLNDLELIKRVQMAAKKFVAENNVSDWPLLSKKLHSLGLAKHLE